MGNNYNQTRFACNISYVVQSIAVNIAPLFFVIFKEAYALTLSNLSFLVLFIFIVQLSADLLSIKIIEKLGFRYTAVLANLTACIGLVLLAVLPQIISPVAGIFIASLFYSSGAGIIEVVINPITEALPNDNIGASLSILHSFYSWGQVSVVLISTIILYFVTNKYWYIIPLIWALIPLYNTIMFTRVPIIEAKKEKISHNTIKLLKSPLFIMLMIVMLCGGATEMTIAQWASFFAEKALGITKVIGDLIGPCMFALMMGIGRLIYGLIADRVSVKKALILCSFLGVLAYTGISLIPNPVIVMVFFALAGIASSVLWPGTLSLSSLKVPHGGTAMFALLAFAGDLGCSVGPWVNGFVSDIVSKNEKIQFIKILGFNGEQASLREGLLISALFPLVMFVFLLIISRFFTRNKGAD